MPLPDVGTDSMISNVRKFVAEGDFIRTELALNVHKVGRMLGHKLPS